MRWQHPVHGLISPDDFIPFADRTGIIRLLTWCILRKALEQIRQWARDGLMMRVSVNISPGASSRRASPTGSSDSSPRRGFRRCTSNSN